MRAVVFMVLMLLAARAHAIDLIVNGDFEEPLAPGWTEQPAGGIVIDRATHYHPDPDYEVHVQKGSGTSEGGLAQTVELLGLDTRFSIQMTCDVSATLDSWAAAGVAVVYLDAEGSRLGETRVVACTSHCPWTNLPTFHLISAAENYWLDYAFAIPEELTNLPGVDPSRVRQVQVRLLTAASGC